MRPVTIVILILSVLITAGLTSCPGNPDAEKEVQEMTKVPGLDEAVLAKDRAIKASLEMSYASDVELLQEQIKVKEVKAGRVTLTGVVSKQELKERAKRIAEEMKGVVDVVSTIEVDESKQAQRIDFDF